MDYQCKYCGYFFFMEEGYDANLDTIICPNCGTHHVREMIKEYE